VAVDGAGNLFIADTFNQCMRKVSPAAAVLVISGPDGAKAGEAFEVTLTAYDAWGNLATGYRGRVAFSSDDGEALLPDPYPFTEDDAGSHTFSVTLNTPGLVRLVVADADDDTLVAWLDLTVA
jgi:hypothetical protein